MLQRNVITHSDLTNLWIWQRSDDEKYLLSDKTKRAIIVLIAATPNPRHLLVLRLEVSGFNRSWWLTKAKARMHKKELLPGSFHSGPVRCKASVQLEESVEGETKDKSSQWHRVPEVSSRAMGMSQKGTRKTRTGCGWMQWSCYSKFQRSLWMVVEESKIKHAEGML